MTTHDPSLTTPQVQHAEVASAGVTSRWRRLRAVGPAAFPKAGPVACLLAAVAVVAGALNTVPGPQHEMFGGLARTSAALFALVCVAAADRRGCPERRRAWGYLLTATACWTAGQVAHEAFALTGANQWPHVADGAWLMFPALAAIGSYRLLPADPNSRTIAVARLEALPLVIAVGTLVWAALHGVVAASSLSLAAKVTAVAYPVLYLSLPIVMAQAFLGGPARARTNRDLLLVLTGLTLQAVAFTFWAGQTVGGREILDQSVIDALSVAGMLVVGTGGLWHDSDAASTEHESRFGGLLPSLMFLTLVFVLMWSAATHQSLSVRLALQVGVLTVGVTMIGRSLLITREHRRVLAEQREAHDELRRARATSARFFELSRDLLFTARDGYFVDVNPAWEQTLGWTREQLLSRPFVEFLHPDDRDRTAAHATSLTGREKADAFQNRCLSVNGDGRWVSWSSHRDDDGLIYARGADITERKQLEAERLAVATQLAAAHEQLEEKAAELNRSNAELEQFANVASHDLAEPLRSISGFSQLLLADYSDRLDDEGREYLGFITDGAGRMCALIDGLLLYSRVGREKPALEQVAIDGLVDNVLQGLHAAIEESGAIVSRGALPTVRADQRELARVFQNLIANAVKFTRPGESPAIRLEAEPHETGWSFSVTDNGIGIEPEFAERVFGLFKRLHQREDYPGTGIGLTIAKRIVERHGGSIWVESAAGGGSIFTFTLSTPRR